MADITAADVAAFRAELNRRKKARTPSAEAVAALSGGVMGPAGVAASIAAEGIGGLVATIRDFMAPKQFTLEVTRVPIGKRGKMAMRVTKAGISPTAGGLIGAGLLALALSGAMRNPFGDAFRVKGEGEQAVERIGMGGLGRWLDEWGAKSTKAGRPLWPWE